MFEKVRNQLAEQLNIDAASITEHSALVADLKADSLDIVALVMDLEAEYDIQIPDDELTRLATVGDIVRYLEEKVG